MMYMKKLSMSLLIAIVFCSFMTIWASAQTEQLKLHLSRDWGYGGLNGDIQGLFSMRVSGPADLVRVEFYIDEQKIGEVSTMPFNLQFSTDTYSLGVHHLTVVGYSNSGHEYSSNIITANFVPKQSASKVMIPVFGVILLAVLLSTLVPFLASRGNRLNLPLGTERNYGFTGGAICPKCNRPFRLPLFSFNMGFKKIAPCPFCGKWSVVGIKSITELRRAESAELGMSEPTDNATETDADKLRKELDDSKYLSP
jgi:hypothetical protein